MLQQTIAIFLVLGLLLGALWLLRRQGLATFDFMAGSGAGKRKGSGRHMQVIERVVLTSQHSLHLVSIDDRLVLFAASPTSCQAVDQSALKNSPMGGAASC